MAHPRRGVGDLPPELHVEIAERLLRPSDLKILCLTSKWFRLAAMPVLYNSVELDLNSLAVPALSSFFLPNNPGLKFVKSLSFKLEWRPRTQQKGPRAITHLAVSMIRENGLRALRLPEDLKLSKEFWLDLARKQQNLSTLHLGPVEHALALTLMSPVCRSGWLASIKELHVLYQDVNSEDLAEYGDVIRKAKKLDTLLIGYKSSRGYHTRGTVLNNPDKSLLRHVAPFGSGPKIPLTRLHLKAVDVRFAEKYCCKAIDFTKLVELATWHCRGTWKLLAHFCGVFKAQAPALKKLVCLSPTRLRRDNMTSILETCVQLRDLHIVFPGNGHQARQAFRIILQAQKKLKSLALGVYQHYDGEAPIEMSATPGPSDMTDLRSSFDSLAELAVGTPTIRVEAALVPCDADQAFLGYLGKVSDIANRRALRILNWPLAPHTDYVHGDGEDLNEHFVTLPDCVLCDAIKLQYRSLMDESATKVLRLIQRWRSAHGLGGLQVLSFGEPTPFNRAPKVTCKVSSVTMWNPGQLVYVPHWQTRLGGAGGGNIELVARPVSQESLHYLDDKCDVVHLFPGREG